MNYEIVATLGPNSNNASVWRAMIAAGITMFRLNTSHLSLIQLQTWLEKLQPFLTSISPVPTLVLDLQGSKWRLGHFQTFELFPGQNVELIFAEKTERANVLPIPHIDFFEAAAGSSPEIVMDDAKIQLEVISVESDQIKVTVKKGGLIKPRKGVTYSASDYRSESLTEKDQTILEKSRNLSFVRYALSYVKDAGEMAGYRAYTGDSTHLIAKLERRQAVDEATQIQRYADELWLCRGDLGAELGYKAMAETVHAFSKQVVSLTKPVFLAGQLLEHMSEHNTPTRSEICTLYDMLTMGYRGVVLSDETAIGMYPVESCRTAAMFRL